MTDIQQTTIEEEMRRSYLDYAMSVIVSRALPDIRDGLKPVHRRILYAMKIGGYDASKPFKKSAKIVGEVMGTFHPHGDGAIYDALVRMAQDFSIRVPLIEGQGNFGSMDGDPPAAMRYTEARLSRAAETLLEDIEKETVDFQPNYDDSTLEPRVLPARFPNLLVNGAGGIAVGMATNIPPHNLGEVIDGTIALIHNPDLTTEQLMAQYIFGPDFPTGGEIIGRHGILSAYSTGHGSVILRARHEIEEIRRDTIAIIITEIPYQLNKSKLLERIAEVAQEKIVEGIGDLRDESDRDGVRIVIELKRGAQADVVLNQLWRATPLQSSFGCNMVALSGGRPSVCTLKDFLHAFIAFRQEVITRRTVFELERARSRAHVLIGLGLAVANIDDIIALIRRAPDPATARDELVGRDWPAADVAPLIALVDEAIPRISADGQTYRMSDAQARAILDLRLQRLTGLEREKIAGELKDVVAAISHYLQILSSRALLFQIMEEELKAVREAFATPRRTKLVEGSADQTIEDLIQREEMVITFSHQGYVKRVPLAAYRAQKRGGRGRVGMSTKEEDFVRDLLVSSTHTTILIFTNRGTAFAIRAWRLPLATPQSRGRPIINFLPLQDGELVTTVLPLPEDEALWEGLDVVFATSGGRVRRNQLSDFARIRGKGLRAMQLEDTGETLIAASLCRADQTLLLTTRGGRCLRFPVEDLRVFAGRESTGVRGITLAEGDQVISMVVLAADIRSPEEREAYLRIANQKRRELTPTPELETQIQEFGAELYYAMAEAEQFVLTVSETGLGKRSSTYEYTIRGRGGIGILAMDMNARTRAIAASFPVTERDQIICVTDGGQLIRMPVNRIRIAGRSTQGVTLFRVPENERIVSVARLADAAEDEEPSLNEALEDLPAEAGDGSLEEAETVGPAEASETPDGA